MIFPSNYNQCMLQQIVQIVYSTAERKCQHDFNPGLCRQGRLGGLGWRS